MTSAKHFLLNSFSALLLTLLPLSGVFAGQEGWTFNQHGVIKACSVLTEDQDGSTLLIRHLVLPKDSRMQMTGDHDATHQCNATEALTSAQALRPDQTHFMTEYYRLDQNNLILNAQLIQGHTDSFHPPWTASRGEAAAYCSEVNHLLTLAQDTSESQIEPGCPLISRRWNVVGLQADEDAFAEPVTLEQPAAPVMMLSGDKATGYQQVYDPLYSIHKALDFDASRYWQYQDSPTFQMTLASLSGAELVGGLTTMGVGVATLNPALIAIGSGLTVSSLITGLYTYSDWIQNPESRAQNTEDSLAYKQQSLQEQLNSARSSEEHYQKELEDMGLFGSEAYIRQREALYQSAELMHYQRLFFLHEELRQLKSGRNRLQAELERSRQNENSQPTMDVPFSFSMDAPFSFSEPEITQQLSDNQDYSLPRYSEQDPYPELTQRLSSPGSVTNYSETFVSDSKAVELPSYEDLPPAYSERDPYPQDFIAVTTLDPPPPYEADTRAHETSTAAYDAMTFIGNLLIGQIADSDTRILLKEAQIGAEWFTFERAHGREGRALKGYSSAKRTIRQSEEGLVGNQAEQSKVAEEFKIMQLLNRYQQAEVAAR